MISFGTDCGWEREYFSLGGCAGPEMLDLDISLWKGVYGLEMKA